MYRKCISAENIGLRFTKLGEEQCEVCLTYYNSHDTKTCRSNKENDTEDEQSQATEAHCHTCLQWKNHIERARKARKLYRQDADTIWCDDYSMRSAYLQKVMLPRLPGCKTAAFTSRSVAFNESFALMGKHSKVKRKHLAVSK